MGLDILLIEITEDLVSEFDYLLVKEWPEIKQKNLEYAKEKLFQNHDGSNYSELVFYFKEISCQRKGVKRTFYKRYKPDEFIQIKDELEELLKHILPEFRQSFHNDFYKRFKEDVTFILMGY